MLPSRNVSSRLRGVARGVPRLPVPVLLPSNTQIDSIGNPLEPYELTMPWKMLSYWPAATALNIARREFHSRTLLSMQWCYPPDRHSRWGSGFPPARATETMLASLRCLPTVQLACCSPQKCRWYGRSSHRLRKGVVVGFKFALQRESFPFAFPTYTPRENC